MKKLKYGIISASSIVPRFIGAIRKTNHSEIIALASQSGKVIDDTIPHVRSYQEIYQNPEIDIVYIANINDQHATEIRNALLANKHVLCEKPMVLSAQEAKELFALAHEKGLFLMEAQKSVFLPATQEVKRIIDSKKLGKLYQVSMNLSYAARHPEGHWMHEKHQGGIWVPSGNYALEYLHYLMQSKPLKEQHLVLRYPPHNAISEIKLVLEYPYEVLADVSLSIRLQTDDTTRFFFEKGWIEVYQHWKARKLVIHRFNQEPEVIQHPIDFELFYEVDHVYECISKGLTSSPHMTKENTIESITLIERINLEN